MQKINFLPQIKVWSTIEFAPVATSGLIPEVDGILTYDNISNAFKVSIAGDNNTHIWKTILLGDTNEIVQKLTIKDSSNNVGYEGNGDITLYTESTYNASTNRIATMADITSLSTGVSNAKIDNQSFVTDTIANLYSDPSSLYNASTNQLATLGTVSTAIANIGTVVRLRQAYNPADITEASTFAEWLTYCNNISAPSEHSWDYYLHDAEGNWNVKKGDVCIWGNEEYICIDKNNPQLIASWELFGKLNVDTCVISLGGVTGAISVDGSSFYMDSNTLKLHAASDTSLGGIKLGYTDSSYQSNNLTYYTFALDSSDNKGYTSIPVQDGNIEAGLISNTDYTAFMNAQNIGMETYVAMINPSTIGSENYNNVHTVVITHNIGNTNVIVSVYKNLTANGSQKQAVYADEVITDASTIRVSFGTKDAFIGCQDSSYGYSVVIGAAKTITSIPDASIAGISNQ